jgi:conjugative relaxase-like TrwC/TraI family protein
MLRIVQNSAPAGAKSYYTSADYYTEGQELEGVWRGKGAAMLGLEGKVEKAQWDALCDNKNPSTGKSLTARQRQGRRVGYDFNFHVPKGVSLVYGLSGDERILEAFRESVDATMRDMEAEMETRVRVGGKNEDRTTGNMVWGEFVHTTARPVDGVPDPHLHAHCFVFNATWDEKESRWKAGEFSALKRNASYFEALFHSRFARRMEEIGIPVERTRKGWEIAGIGNATLKKFSRRTELIEAKARAEGITDPAEKGELGAKTRSRKEKHLSMDELRREWRSRLSDGESGALHAVIDGQGRGTTGEDKQAAAEAVKLALSHCFERNAVVPERKLLVEAMKRSYGAAAPESVARVLAEQDLVSGEVDGERQVTTKDVLIEERRMLDFARSGRGACAQLGAEPHPFTRDWLNAGQRRAVSHLLTSHDRVMLLRGRAGTGKTSLMQEAVEAIEASGHKVFTFAPSAEASRGVLRQEGFAHADTVARLLLDERLQEKVRGQVMWIDEAGLLGTRTMAHVFDLAKKLDARIILSGDRRQHGSVERGAALRLLETEAGIVPAEIKDIQRQKGDYKQAVQALSDGRTAAGFRDLDKLGWIREVSGTERYHALAHEYVADVRAGKSALVISPTHLEGDRITQSIRSELKREGRLSGNEHELRILTNANFTEAERADSVNYSAGDVLVFHQNAKGFKKGERIHARGGTLPLDQAARFDVFHSHHLEIAQGEVLRVTRNGTTIDRKHRLNNGQLVTVKKFDCKGNLVLANGWTVSKDYGFLAHGYVVTSHASQGKTVDRVIIGQSADSMRAASREQFYVSVSRGRERATIFTDDKKALLEAVSRSDDRVAATELARSRKAKQRIAILERFDDQRSAEREPRERGPEKVAYVR